MNPLSPHQPLDPARERVLLVTLAGIQFAHILDFMITIYLTANVGVRQEDIPLIYLCGGCATFFTSRLVGRLADASGRIVGYAKVGWLAVGATFIAIAFVGRIHMHTGKPPG